MALKFLLIDDVADDRSLFCEALSSIDPQIICYTASGGRQALTTLNSGEIASPDIIFLDINMPRMNGWQCLSILKQLEMYKHIPVILYSTTSLPDDIEKSHSSGAFCFFTKPSSFKELKRLMELVVTYLKNDSLPSLMENSSFAKIINVENEH